MFPSNKHFKQRITTISTLLQSLTTLFYKEFYVNWRRYCNTAYHSLSQVFSTYQLVAKNSIKFSKLLMETMSVLITYFNCGPKSVVRNPHNLKRGNLPVSLVWPRSYLYSNTGIAIKKIESVEKHSQRTRWGHQRSRGFTFFFAVARNFKENVSRGGNECLRSWCPEWHYLPQPATLGECAPRRRPALISTRPAPFTSARRRRL